MRRRQIEAARGNTLAVLPSVHVTVVSPTPRELRERAGLSVAEVAAMLDVSESYIRSVEACEKVRQRMIEALL